MIFPRRYLALDLRQQELRAVSLKGKRKQLILAGAQLMALEAGLVQPSPRSVNVSDPARLKAAIQEVLDPIAAGEERLALILPETVGRLFTVEVETPFSSKAEGEKIIKWQLKGNFPADPESTVLDFQVLAQRDDGRKRLLVAAVPRNVLDEYEAVVTAAGYFPVLVGFHSIFLHNYYRTRLEQPDESVLLILESGLLSFEYSQGRVPLYHRFRMVGNDRTAIFQEISRALVGAQEDFPGLKRAAVFLHCDLAETEGILDIFQAAFQHEVVLLDPHIDRISSQPSDWPKWRLRGLTAAVGAAEQMI
jgi:Tfp pilus assembly PilM family ATPase